MDLSIPLSGMQSADASFDSAARSIVQSFDGASSGPPGDSVQLSSAVAGLLMSKLDFIANEKVAVVEDSINKSAISILG